MRGTVFDVVVQDDEGTTFVTVDEGEVAVRNMTAQGNSAILHPGESITVYRGVPLFARQIDKGNIAPKCARCARDTYYQIMISGPAAAVRSEPCPGSGGAQGDKGKGGATTVRALLPRLRALLQPLLALLRPAPAKCNTSFSFDPWLALACL